MKKLSDGSWKMSKTEFSWWKKHHNEDEVFDKISDDGKVTVYRHIRFVELERIYVTNRRK